MTGELIHVVSLPINGGIVLIDAADYPKICGYEWYIRGGYAVAKRDNEHVYMHRLILGLPQGRTPSADHINRLPHDNRRCNLRACTHKENMRNKKKPVGGTSIFKGVSKRESGWHAAITFEGKKRYLGIFSVEQDAAKAYDEAACELFGEFANLNFPHLRAAYEQSIAERKLNPVPKRDRRHDRKRVYRSPDYVDPTPPCVAATP